MKRKLLTLAIGTCILSLIGLYNGYPLVYSDTGTYIDSGFANYIPVDRPVSYGIFIRHISLKESTWLVILFQNFLTAFVLYELLFLIFSKNELFEKIYFGILLFLIITTGIGWYSNQLMPDFFAPLAIMSIFILLSTKRRSVLSTLLLILILFYSLISHFSHLLIGSSLVILILLVNLFSKKKNHPFTYRRIVFVASLVTAGWIGVLMINYMLEQKATLSKGSHVFLMAHLVDAGILDKFLQENCSKRDFSDCKLCDYKDNLPKDLASFIWTADVLENTGGWYDSKDEYNRIIQATLNDPKYLKLNLFRSISYGTVQVVEFDIGQGLSAYNRGSSPWWQIHEKYHHELNSYLQSKQNKWEGAQLSFTTLNDIHLGLILLSFAITLIVYSSACRKRMNSRTLYFLSFTIGAIIVNAFCTAGLNAPCSRFQARVVWLLPLAVFILVMKNQDVIIASLKKTKMLDHV